MSQHTRNTCFNFRLREGCTLLGQTQANRPRAFIQTHLPTPLFGAVQIKQRCVFEESTTGRPPNLLHQTGMGHFLREHQGQIALHTLEFTHLGKARYLTARDRLQV